MTEPTLVPDGAAPVTPPTSTAPAPAAQVPATEQALVLARRIGIWRLVAIVGGVVGFGYLWANAGGRFLEGTIWQVPLVLLLLILTWPWRTISARTVVGFFLIGFGPIFFLTVLTGNLLMLLVGDLLGDLSRSLAVANVGSLGNVQSTILAPPTEEIWKLVPLLAVFLWARSGLRRLGGPLDFALLAAATGAGFGFAEDLFVLGGPFWTRPDSPLLGLGVGTLYTAFVVNPFNRGALPVIPSIELDYQGIVGIFNPSVEELPLGAIWAGHGVLPLVVGLALGFAVLGRRRFGRIAYLLPVLALLWAMWDHFVGNWYSSTTCGRADAPTLCGLAQLDLVGGILPIVAILAVGGAILTSRRAMARHYRIDPAIHVSRAELMRLGRSTITQPRAFLAFVTQLHRWLRLRNRVAFGDLQYAGMTDAKRKEVVVGLWTARTEAFVLAERLRGKSVPEVPAETQAMFDGFRSPL